MTELLLLVRNLLLGALMAWLGLEFSPAAPDKSPEDNADGTVRVIILP